MHGINEWLVIMSIFGDGEEVGAFAIHAPLVRNGGSLGLAFREVMPLEDIDHGVAIGNHIAVELPGAA